MNELPPDKEDLNAARSGPKYRATSKKGWRRFFTWKAFLLYFLGFLLLGAGAVTYLFVTIDVPEPNDFSTSETTIVAFDDGESELGRFSVENREIVNTEDIPDTLRNAVVAAEDRSFYENPGFSITGTARAAWQQLTGSASAGGGSTITQQYVKNYYLTQDQTWTRKLNELVIAVKVDQETDKDQILTDYLNTIWFGRGTYGVQTASQAYFGVDVAELDLAQSAALAAILRSPSLYDPTVSEDNADRFEQRFDYVLNGMVEIGAIDQQTAAETELPEIQDEVRENRYGGPKGYLLKMVRDELLTLGFTESEIDSGGLRVTTTFNERVQDVAQRAVDEERPTENADGVRVGLASVRPGDGGIVALYGGPDAVEQSVNDAVDARIQPGSTVKPFTLAAGLEEGYSLYSGFAGNSPYEAEGLGPPVANQNDVSYGWSVDLTRATANSINTAFVDLTYNIGSQTVVDAMVRAGIPEDAPGLDPNARVTLGIASVSPLEMAEAYATLAAQGMHADTYTVSEVRDSSGEVVYEHDGETRRAFDEDVMADVTYAMTQVVDGGTGARVRELGFDRPAAGKTGTHQDQTSWFAGFTPQLATTVAYFRGDGTDSLDGVGGMENFAGGGYPATTWTAFMKSALRDEPVAEFPEPAYVNAYTPVAPPSGEYYDDDSSGGGDASGYSEPDEEESDESGGDESGGDQSGGDESGGDESGGDESGGDESGGDESGGDQSGGDESGGDESGGDESGGDQSGGDESGGDQSGGDESGGDESGGDQSGGDESGGDESGDVWGGEDGDGTGTSSASALGDETAYTRPTAYRSGVTRVLT
ncbi:transglycosylase domain-containing protein [Phytoactinopolyspora halotolerans]|uniref:Penicillin-binding protein n=1 Tax=Phytoactinopolyspora halotolerans TaxID=1981512 RepID=A0A6L9S2S4_9ACTN|nr:transglycosylase domain-containing protein [Phytoactinopolyspora halotolerans]NED99352.1 penicillin-binding protein [Phytoactinopolyspora halotolerans]